MSRRKVPLRGLGAALQEEISVVLKAQTVERIRANMSSFLDKWNDRAPVKSGWFRGSLLGYHGEPPSDFLPRGLPLYPPIGDDQIDGALADFEVGDRVGFVDNTPHASRLAEGWSQQAPDGWIDTIVSECQAEFGEP